MIASNSALVNGITESLGCLTKPIFANSGVSFIWLNVIGFSKLSTGSVARFFANCSGRVRILLASSSWLTFVFIHALNKSYLQFIQTLSAN